MDLDEVIDKRHSVRKYETFSIPDADIEKMLQAANKAPSAGNLQSYKIFVIRGKEKKALVSRCSFGQDFINEASLVLVFAADPEAAYHEYGSRGRYLYCIQDATIAATFTILKATDMGYSTSWIGHFDELRLRANMGAMDYNPVAIILVGKAGEKPEPKTRKNLKSLALFVD